MNSLETQVEGSYERQAAMLEQLKDCLELERESLIQVDVDQLWELMEKKNALMLDIEKAGNAIKCLMEQCFPGSPESPRANALKYWPWFRDLRKQTDLLKEDIRARLKENMSFIQDTLGFFDELIGTILKGGTERLGYEHLKKAQEPMGPKIYYREA
jgi:hypothetical protein